MVTAMQSSFFDTQPVPGGTGMLLLMNRPSLTEEENLEQLERDFISLMDTYGVRQVILDLQSVNYVTSAAVGKLIALHRRLARANGRLILCSLQSNVQSTLALSQLLNYFNVTETADDALSQLML
jgi:Anti-anti-sigma regulatory factor (antagonist of anti-sigma factor)